MSLLVYMFMMTCSYIAAKEIIIKKVSNFFRFILQVIQLLYILTLVITAYCILQLDVNINDTLIHNTITEVFTVLLLIPAAWHPVQYFKINSHSGQTPLKEKRQTADILNFRTVKIKGNNNTTNVSLTDNSIKNSYNTVHVSKKSEENKK